MFKLLDLIKAANGHSANQCPSCKGYVRNDEIECSHCGIPVNQTKIESEFTQKIRQVFHFGKQT